jgi:hypothetical protein
MIHKRRMVLFGFVWMETSKTLGIMEAPEKTGSITVAHWHINIIYRLTTSE